MKTYRSLWILSAMCAVLLTPSGARAQNNPEDAFKAGMDARNDKKWQEAAQQMRRAIGINPQESTKKVGGLFGRGGTEYLPHFYLGEALFNLNNCVEAVSEFGKSEQQGVVRAKPELMRIIQTGYTACEAKGVLSPAKYEPIFVRATQLVTEASNQASLVRGKGDANPEVWQQGDARAQYDRAAAEVQNARTRLESATKTHSQADFGEAVAAADRARALLVTLDNTLSAALYARLSTQAQAKDVQTVLDSADEYDRAIEARKASLTPALAATRQQGQGALGRAREQMTAGVRTSSTSALTDARAVAQNAATQLKSVLDEVTRIEHDAVVLRVSEAAARGREAFALVDSGFTNFERLSATRPAGAGADNLARRDAIQKRVTAARSRFDAAVKGENLQGVVAATKLATDSNTELNNIILTFGPLTLQDRGVHPALIEGARLFFAGQYEQALSALDPPDGFPSEQPLLLHVHLFRAASTYALFVRSGETNQELREKTIAEIEQCKLIDSTFAPDGRVFTPRFITAFQAGTVAGGVPATGAGSPR